MWQVSWSFVVPNVFWSAFYTLLGFHSHKFHLLSSDWHFIQLSSSVCITCPNQHNLLLSWILHLIPFMALFSPNRRLLCHTSIDIAHLAEHILPSCLFSLWMLSTFKAHVSLPCGITVRLICIIQFSFHSERETLGCQWRQKLPELSPQYSSSNTNTLGTSSFTAN